LHRNNYFDESRRNINLIKELIAAIWEEFLRLPEVRSAIDYETGTTSVRLNPLMLATSKDKVKQVIEAIWKLRFCLVAAMDLVPPMNPRLLQKPFVFTSFSAHHTAIQSMVVTPFDELVTTGKGINVWQDCKLRCQLARGGFISGNCGASCMVTFGMFVISGLKNSVNVWMLDPNNPDLHVRLASTDTAVEVNSVAVMPRGPRVFAGLGTGKIQTYILGAKELTVTCSFLEHNAQIPCMAISNDSQLLYSASLDRTLKVWHLEEIPHSGTFASSHTIRDLSGNPSKILIANPFLIVAFDNTLIFVWNIVDDPYLDGSQPRQLLTNSPTHAIASFNNLLYVASTGGIHVWDLQFDGANPPVTPLTTLAPTLYSITQLIVMDEKLIYEENHSGTLISIPILLRNDLIKEIGTVITNNFIRL
jgi:hypothetical protein